jgi:hydroxypyruvate reductase
MHREGHLLHIGGKEYDLTCRRVLIVAVGKAGVSMASAAAHILGEHLSGGIVVTKDGHLSHGLPPTLTVYEAGHPVPDARGVFAAGQVATLLEQAGADDLVLALISGGGSALLTLPAPGLTLEAMQQITGSLLASGATINELNMVRKHLEVLKGGGLARIATPATLATLVLSDVVGSPLDVIASGPSVADTTTFADAWAVLERYGLQAAPAAIVAHLQAGLQGMVPDTPKPGDSVFAHAQIVVVGDNQQAADAALAEARALGYHTLLLSTYAQGEARDVGRVLGAVARQIAATGQPVPRPACIVIGGETTVTLRGSGRGGRNQELALAATTDLAELPGVALVALATDGGDGPTDAAGAVATGETMARARAAGLNHHLALANNDSYHFFDTLGDLLRPGPTGTNVNDLAFIFVW